MSQIYDLVMEEVEKIPPPKKRTDNYTVIICPYHSDSHPSGRIMHHTDGRGAGSFKCYSCGAKASWNDLASILGLKPYNKKQEKKDIIEVPATNIENLDKEFLDHRGPRREKLQLFPLTNEKAVKNSGLPDPLRWRGFKLSFLEDIGIQFAYVRKYDEEGNLLHYGWWCMYLPIDIRGKTRGYIKAQIEKPKDKNRPSYINSHGGWSLKLGLFPFDPAIQAMRDLGVTTIALVEGPRDALRLIRYGIPAVCIMGTQSWSKNKIRMLEMAGVTRIIVMMDGDAAGRKATRLITTGLDVNGNVVCPPLADHFTVKVVRLWLVESSNNMEYDPGNCPVGILRDVKKLVK